MAEQPIVRVQHLSESGSQKIPALYVKPASERPNPNYFVEKEVPIVDMLELYSDDPALREKANSVLDGACKEWGFFQLVNHDVSQELMRRTRAAWSEFFHLPLEEKEKKKFVNDPPTIAEGYGSGTYLEKGAYYYWFDYYFLFVYPPAVRDLSRWPALPSSLRELMEVYSEELAKLGDRLLATLSTNLGLKETHIKEAFGGDRMRALFTSNLYPTCRQPDLTFGFRAHSDIGGITLLQPDYDVPGLQVRDANSDDWVTIKAAPGGFIVNMGDQMEILANGVYKSAEHRVVANQDWDRLSLVYFYNPMQEAVIKPAKELVTAQRPQMFPAMTFEEYWRNRNKDPQGKAQIKAHMLNK